MKMRKGNKCSVLCHFCTNQKKESVLTNFLFRVIESNQGHEDLEKHKERYFIW